MEHINNNLSLGQQYIVQKGLKIYSEKGEAGIKKEMKQTERPKVLQSNIGEQTHKARTQESPTSSRVPN